MKIVFEESDINTALIALNQLKVEGVHRQGFCLQSIECSKMEKEWNLRLRTSRKIRKGNKYGSCIYC